MSKVFFTSYARDDNADSKLGKAVERLKERVAANLGLTREDAENIAFFDTTDIKSGKDWEENLGEAVRNIRVLVCLCSPRYLNREYCAKEFEVFRRRLEAAGLSMKDLVAIIPVIWERGAPPMVLPEVVSKHQWRDDRFPKSYGPNGLSELGRLPSQREKFTRTIDVLADAIGTAYARSKLAAWPNPIKFDELPSWFHNPQPGPYNVTLTVLDPRRSQWKPVLGRPSVGGVLDAVTTSLQVAWEEIPADLQLEQRLSEAVKARQASIVMVARNLVGTSPWKEHLDVIARVGRSAPLALLFGIDAAADAGGAAGTVGMSPVAPDSALLPPADARGKVLTDSFVTDDLKSLSDALTRSITMLRMALVAADPAEKVQNQELSDAARREGISVETRPIIVGPTGGAP